MEGTVTLRNWQFFFLMLTAAYALLQLLILPLLQRLIYNRSQTAERILDEELEFGLPSYALANRQLWVDRIVSDPKVKDAIANAANTLESKDAASGTGWQESFCGSSIGSRLVFLHKVIIRESPKTAAS